MGRVVSKFASDAGFPEKSLYVVKQRLAFSLSPGAKLEFGHKTASRDDIKSFYHREHKLAIRMVPKLTEKHIDPNGLLKMRVKLASQIFSHSVAAGIYAYASMNVLNSSAIGTAEFIEKMDVRLC
eukprot:gene16148-7511_t